MRVSLGAFSLSAAILLAGALHPVHAQAPIRIGALYPLSGSLALLGNENLEGARVAVAMINDKGGIGGHPVELITGDAATPDKAQSEAERLVSLEKLDIITGTYSSGLSYAASQVIERHGGIYWETGGIADGLTKRGFKSFFRVPFTASSNGQLAAAVAKDLIAPKLGKPPSELTVLVLHEDSDYGTSVATAAEEDAKAAGFKVAGRLAYKASSTDLSPLVLRIRASGANIVIASSYATDALLIQRQMKQLNVNVAAFIGTGGIYGLPSFADGLGSAVNGLFDTEGSALVNPDALSADARTLLAEFRQRFETKVGRPPSYVGVQGFVGTYLLLHDVLAKTGSTDPAKVRPAVLALDLPDGSTALGWGVKFASDTDSSPGQNLRAFPVAQQWQDGKLVVVAPAKLKTAEPTNVPLPAWSAR